MTLPRTSWWASVPVVPVHVPGPPRSGRGQYGVVPTDGPSQTAIEKAPALLHGAPMRTGSAQHPLRDQLHLVSRSSLRRIARQKARTARLRRRGLTAGLAVVAVLVGGGFAFAYMTYHGSGTATAEVVGSSQVTARAGSVTGQYPGAAPAALPVVVQNDGAAPFTVTDVELAGGFPSDCPASAWHLDLPDTLPTVAPTSAATVPVTVAMSADAPDSCQGVTMSVPFTVTGTTG